MPLGLPRLILVLLPLCWQLLPSYGQMTTSRSGFSFDQFSNRSGNRAYLKNIGSDWPSLVHPKPITILEGCRLQLARPGVRPPSLPTRGKSDRPRVCACKVGVSRDVSSKEKISLIFVQPSFILFLPGGVFQGAHFTLYAWPSTFSVSSSCLSPLAS